MIDNDETTRRPITLDPETTWEVTQVFFIDGNEEPGLPQVIALTKDQTDLQPISQYEMIAEQAEDVVCGRYREFSKQLYSPFNSRTTVCWSESPQWTETKKSHPRVFKAEGFLPLSLPAPLRASQGIKDVRLHETEVQLVSNGE